MVTEAGAAPPFRPAAMAATAAEEAEPAGSAVPAVRPASAELAVSRDHRVRPAWRAAPPTVAVVPVAPGTTPHPIRPRFPERPVEMAAAGATGLQRSVTPAQADVVATVPPATPPTPAVPVETAVRVVTRTCTETAAEAGTAVTAVSEARTPPAAMRATVAPVVTAMAQDPFPRAVLVAWAAMPPTAVRAVVALPAAPAGPPTRRAARRSRPEVPIRRAARRSSPEVPIRTVARVGRPAVRIRLAAALFRCVSNGGATRTSIPSSRRRPVTKRERPWSGAQIPRPRPTISFMISVVPP